MARGRARTALAIGAISSRPAAAGTRVTAEVDGLPVWFESGDVALEAAPEAVASAFLLPALHFGDRLTLDQALDPVWSANAGRLVAIFHDWWRYPRLVPEAPTASLEADGAAPSSAGQSRPANSEPGAARPAEAASRGAVALFFSGGVDSFYSLLHGGRRPDLLVTVQGFDVALDDAHRMAAVERTLRAVGEAHGIRTAVVRTNLRDHPRVRALAWERAHGGALAAVGLLLGGEASEVWISSSIARHRERSWGSHWRTDPLFSSSRVGIRQIGMELRRTEKIPRIAGDPLARRHLRVCWENRASEGNCSRCAKCLITRLVLAGCGALEAFPVFEGKGTLAHDLDALPAYHDRLKSLTELSVNPRLDPDVRRATVALLKRSRHAHSLPVRARRALLGRVLRLAGARRS